MAYTTPLTAVSNATLTAAQWNASVRDDFAETAVAKATSAGQFFVSTAANALAARVPTGATVNVSESTTSTSYAAIPAGTPGPAVTVTTGTAALVAVSAKMSQSTATANSYMAYAVSGATTIASNDNTSLLFQFATNTTIRATAVTLQTGLTAGSNTFTAQYRVSAGTGTYDSRHLAVLPF